MRALRVIASTALAISVSACAHAPASPTFTPALFKPAQKLNDPTPVRHTPTVVAGTLIGPRLPQKLTVSQPTFTAIRAVEAANRRALEEPTSSAYTNAVQVYPYSEDALYRLYAAPQQVTDVLLQAGETLSAISSGDTVRWAVGNSTSGSGATSQVHVLVKPFRSGLRTNLVILTNRHTYHLLLESTDRIAMAAISWSYPNDGLVSENAQSGAPLTETLDTGLTLGSLNFSYRITGDDPSWRPLRAFDDGHKTYIEFPAALAQGDAPPLFVVGENGGSDLVNYRVRGNYYVVDRLFEAAELRLGTDNQQIVRITRFGRQDKQAGIAPTTGG